jgi:hypothetical protein
MNAFGYHLPFNESHLLLVLVGVIAAMSLEILGDHSQR